MHSFKEKVAQAAIEYAQQYSDIFLDHEYLLCSEAFSNQDYYIISAHADNYRHLIGVNTEISAEDFFEKCITKTLTVDDFNFSKKGQSEKDVKGAVRDKLKALPDFLSMMERALIAQESFSKNRVHCSLATTDKSATVGFIAAGKAKPKTLLRGNRLDSSQSGTVDLILSKSREDQFFSSITYGDENNIKKYHKKIETLLSPELHPKESQEPISV